jgi:hypothetical protein
MHQGNLEMARAERSPISSAIGSFSFMIPLCCGEDLPIPCYILPYSPCHLCLARYHPKRLLSGATPRQTNGGYDPTYISVAGDPTVQDHDPEHGSVFGEARSSPSRPLPIDEGCTYSTGH